MDYENDKRFCTQCGSFLVQKEGLLSEMGDPGEIIEEKPREKFICPSCKIIYEKTKACIRCGAEVVSLSSFKIQEEIVKTPEPEAEKQPSKVLTTQEWIETPLEHLICKVCKKEHLGGKSCIRCGAELVSASSSPSAKEKIKPPRSLTPKKSTQKQPTPSEGEEIPFQEETAAPPSLKMTVEEQLKKGRLLRKVKRDYPRTVLNWSGIAIICIAAGYLLWSMYAHIFSQKPDPVVTPPSTEKAFTPTPASSSISSSGASFTETDEIDKIKSLLENIRKANLRKDLDLFLSCYSNDLKDREGKKKSTLESWEHFNFLDLTYHLGNLTLSGDQARARVEWLVKFSPKRGGSSQESKTILDVVFKKEQGMWKIVEVK